MTLRYHLRPLIPTKLNWSIYVSYVAKLRPRATYYFKNGTKDNSVSFERNAHYIPVYIDTPQKGFSTFDGCFGNDEYWLEKINTIFDFSILKTLLSLPYFLPPRSLKLVFGVFVGLRYTQGHNHQSSHVGSSLELFHRFLKCCTFLWFF